MKKNYWYFSGQYIYLCKHWSLGDTNDVRNSDISRKNFASKSLANVYTFLKAIPICLEKNKMNSVHNSRPYFLIILIYFYVYTVRNYSLLRKYLSFLLFMDYFSMGVNHSLMMYACYPPKKSYRNVYWSPITT